MAHKSPYKDHEMLVTKLLAVRLNEVRKESLDIPIHRIVEEYRKPGLGQGATRLGHPIFLHPM
jgi:hypothetical protein